MKRCPARTRGVDENFHTAAEALSGLLFRGMTVMSGGFGLAGTPEKLIDALLAGRIQAGGAGIPALHTKTGVGTVLAEGTTVETFDGQLYLRERWLRADPSIPLARGDQIGSTSLKLSDFDLIEINEAFAAQIVGFVRALALDPADPRISPSGGTIALGHPLGMSGARLALITTKPCARRTLVTPCVGVGQGVALAFERM